MLTWLRNRWLLWRNFGEVPWIVPPWPSFTNARLLRFYWYQLIYRATTDEVYRAGELVEIRGWRRYSMGVTPMDEYRYCRTWLWPVMRLRAWWHEQNRRWFLEKWLRRVDVFFAEEGSYFHEFKSIWQVYPGMGLIGRMYVNPLTPNKYRPRRLQYHWCQMSDGTLARWDPTILHPYHLRREAQRRRAERYYGLALQQIMDALAKSTSEGDA